MAGYKRAASRTYHQKRKMLKKTSLRSSFSANLSNVTGTREFQSNITDIMFFLAKFLSGKSNIAFTPMQGKVGFACAREKRDGTVYYRIIAPSWSHFNVPLDPHQKYRIYRSCIWHEACHARYTPAEVFYYGAKPDPNLTEDVPDIVKYRVEDPLRHDVINIIEDRRIEDMGVEMWPGYKHERLFSNAYFWSQRMDVGEFFERYLSHFYDDKTGKYDISSMIPPGSNSKVRRAYREYLNRRIARMRHEAFLQRLITGKIKGADKLPLKERQLIENVAAEVEDALKPIEKEDASKAKVVETLVNLTEKVIKKLKLKYYKPPIRRLGDSSWNQTFEEPMETDPKEVKAGIDDYFDEIIEVEYICTKCGRPYSRRYGHRIKPGGGAPPPGVNVRGRT